MKKTFYYIFLLMILSSSAFSQNYNTFDSEFQMILDTTRFRFGPFRIFPRIVLTEVGYDSDVYRSSAIRDPISDFTFIFSPEIGLKMLVRNSLILSFTYSPEYVYYSNESHLRGWTNSYSPEFRWRLISSLVVSGRYSYLTRRRRPSPEINERIDETREGYGGSIFLEARSNLNFGIGALSEQISYGDHENLEPDEIPWISTSLSRTENVINAELNYIMFSEREFFLNWIYSEYDFKYPEAQFRDSYSYQVSTGLRFPVIGRIRGSISIGYKNLTPRSEEFTRYSGIIGDTSLDYRISRFAIRVGFRRDVPFSQFRSNIYFINNQINTGVSFYLSRSIRLDYNFYYGNSKYTEQDTIRLPDGTSEEIYREDIYRTHVAGFAYRIYENTGIGLQFYYWDRDSNYYLARRNSAFFGGYVVYDF